jgi:hypothetical protein
MGVIPAWKIRDIVEGPEMKSALDAAKEVAKAARARRQDAIGPDSAGGPSGASDAGDENPNHREDFMHLVASAGKARKQDD